MFRCVNLAADLNLYKLNNSRFVHSPFKLYSHEALQTAFCSNQDSLTIFLAGTLLLLYPSNWRQTSLTPVCHWWDSISAASLVGSFTLTEPILHLQHQLYFNEVTSNISAGPSIFHKPEHDYLWFVGNHLTRQAHKTSHESCRSKTCCFIKRTIHFQLTPSVNTQIIDVNINSKEEINLHQWRNVTELSCT